MDSGEEALLDLSAVFGWVRAGTRLEPVAHRHAAAGTRSRPAA
ncbi:hypothetical protein [Streptomyces sp. NBC_01443]|nr:hypothetical protein [Streptomyces sp. NBC_01443]MCX4625301.1 hypothetical protein [Streptomyces sp. NBC_01443]